VDRGNVTELSCKMCRALRTLLLLRVLDVPFGVGLFAGWGASRLVMGGVGISVWRHQVTGDPFV